MSMFMDVGLCISFFGNLRGNGLVKGFDKVVLFSIFLLLNLSMGLCCFSEDVARVMPEEHDLDFIILLLKSIK